MPKKFVKRGPSWWNRDRESYCWSAGEWLYYSNSIASGIRTPFTSLPAEIREVETRKSTYDR